MKLLLADDDPDTRWTLRVLLERAGHQVTVAEDGARALMAQLASPADVLLTDLFMPEVDGIEVIGAFRRDHPHVKIVAMSGGGLRVQGGAYLTVATNAGADAVLRKPVAIDELLRTLRDLTR